ncbi:hypothetical protein AMECASPLE_019052, partial [Ameca splendens]
MYFIVLFCRAHSSEIQLLGEAKRCRAELEQLQVEVQSLEEQEGPSEEPDGEVSKLRRQLLQAYNERKAAEEREHTARHELQWTGSLGQQRHPAFPLSRHFLQPLRGEPKEFPVAPGCHGLCPGPPPGGTCLEHVPRDSNGYRIRLWEEKQYLEREIQTQPAVVESNTDMLKEKHDVLNKEVAQRQLDVRTLMEDVETLETVLLKEQKELEEKKEIIKIKEAEKAQLACIPNQIVKDTERKCFIREVAMKKMEYLSMELSETVHQMRSLNEGNQSLEVMKEEAMQELERLRAQIEARLKENRLLLKEQEICREESAEIMGSRGILEMKLKNLMTDRKQLYDSRSVQLRKKNGQVEDLRRMEQAVAMATEQLVCTQSAYKEIQAQVLDAFPEREASAQQRMELEKEIDGLKASFEKQVSMAEDQTQYGMIQELLMESNRLREELHNLRCLRQIKAEEKGKKHREWLKAQQQRERIQQELREKELIIMDHNKLNVVLQH